MREAVADEAHAAQDDIDTDQGAEAADKDSGNDAVAEKLILKWSKQNVHSGQDSFRAETGFADFSRLS